MAITRSCGLIKRRSGRCFPAVCLTTILLLIPAVVSCATSQKAVWPGTGWERGDGDGFAALDRELSAESHGLTSLIVVQAGRLVYEGYWNGFAPGEMTALYSATKSINSLLTGIAIDRGVLPGVKLRIGDYLALPPEADPAMADITLENLLCLRTGVDYDEWRLDYNDPDNPYNAWLKADDRAAFALTLPMTDPLSDAFRYQTPMSQLVPRILEEAAGRDCVSLAHEWLFAPLGIPEERVIWRLDAQGHARVAACNMVPLDLARIGLLVLRDGNWRGEQIVSSAWIAKSLEPAARVRYATGFGYHWWLRTIGETRVTGAEGYGGQCLFILPEKDLVVVTTGDLPRGPEDAFLFLRDRVLPVLEN